jgi:tRNA (Thr-GGU) A37 N-methylase
MTTTYEIRPVGHVESPLVDADTALKQGFEGAPDAWLVSAPGVAEAAGDLAAGTEVFVLTWLHQARRNVLAVHPRMTRAIPRPECSAPDRRTDPIRSGCAGSRSPRLADVVCWCGIWKPSMGRPSWT